MPKRWRQWRALPRSERMVLLGMMLALPVLSAGLRMFGYARMRRWVESATARDSTRVVAPHDLAQSERIAQLAGIAGRHGPIHATCLRQALLVYGLLRRRGLAPELKIGVRRGDAAPDMHAWVELEDTPLGQARLEHVPFALNPAVPETRPPACQRPS